MGKEMEERGGKMGLKESNHKRKRRRLLKREGVKEESEEKTGMEEEKTGMEE